MQPFREPLISPPLHFIRSVIYERLVAVVRSQRPDRAGGAITPSLTPDDITQAVYDKYWQDLGPSERRALEILSGDFDNLGEYADYYGNLTSSERDNLISFERDIMEDLGSARLGAETEAASVGSLSSNEDGWETSSLL